MSWKLEAGEEGGEGKPFLVCRTNNWLERTYSVSMDIDRPRYCPSMDIVLLKTQTVCLSFTDIY